MKWKIFTMNITYFLYFNIFNGKKITSLKSLASEVLLSLRLDKVLIYKPIFCLKIGKWIPHTLPRYIQRFLLIIDIRVGANNSFPDGCHFKVKQKHRSLKLLTASIIIILSLLWEHYKHLKWILKGGSEWPWGILSSFLTCDGLCKYLLTALSYCHTESMLFSFPMIEYWSSGKIMCNTVL